MVYQKTNWKNGMVISSDGLNNMEDGVESISLDNESLKYELAQIGAVPETFANLAALQSKYPAGKTGIFVTADNRHNYIWVNGVWTDAGVYQSVGIADGSITNAKLAMLPLVGTIGKNLFDGSSASYGYYIRYNDGLMLTNINYYASDYIEVTPNTRYVLSGTTEQSAYYDANKVFITGYSNRSAFNANATPANAKYVRLSMKNTEINSVQLELGNTITSYEPYQAYFDESTIKTPISKSRLDSSLFSGVRGKNLFNPSTATSGYYIIYQTGLPSASANYYASDYIEVQSNASYQLSGTVQQFAYYDANKSHIIGYPSGAQLNENLTPANAKYVRLSMKNTEINSVQLELGNTITSYEPYGYYLDTLKISSDNIEYITERVNGNRRVDVKLDGTGDFTSLVTAVNSIKDSSDTNVYDIYIHEDHDIINELGGQTFAESLTSSSDRTGLTLPAYVNLHGVGMITLSGEILHAWNAGYNAIKATSILEIYRGFNKIENITFIAKNMRYAVHDESAGAVPNTWVNWSNVKFIHLGNEEFKSDPNGYWNKVAAYGAGASSGTYRTFTDATFISNAYGAFYMHDSQNFTSPVRLKFDNSEFINEQGYSSLTQDIILSTYLLGTVSNLATINNSIFKSILIKNENAGSTDNRWRVTGGGNTSSAIAETTITVPATISI